LTKILKYDNISLVIKISLFRRAKSKIKSRKQVWTSG